MVDGVNSNYNLNTNYEVNNKEEIKAKLEETGLFNANTIDDLTEMVSDGTDIEKVIADAKKNVEAEDTKKSKLKNFAIKLGFNAGGAGVGAFLGSFIFPPIGSIVGGIIGGALGNHSGNQITANKEEASWLANIGGAGAGAGVGAAIGSIVPGVGTLIGAIVGGVVGAFTGEKLADNYHKYMDEPQTNTTEET